MSSPFAGSEDADLLQILHRHIRTPRNEPQRVFRLAWDAVEIVHQETGGFEALFEYGPSPENCAAAFEKIGIPSLIAGH